MPPARLLDPIGSFPKERILGYGRTGFVVREDGFAVKLPLGWSRDDSDEMVEANIKSLQHEQAIYKRLGECDGVVSYIDFSETSTRLSVMENGDLRSYLTQHNKPSKSLQLSWFRVMARTLAYIHDRRVLVADIATRNFLLDSDLSIKICDFTESIIMPPDTCMKTADYEGYSIRTDIEQLEAVMYEMVVEEKCAFDIFKNVSSESGSGIWPNRENLPSTQGVWLGSIIENRRCISYCGGVVERTGIHQGRRYQNIKFKAINLIECGNSQVLALHYKNLSNTLDP